MMNTLRKYSWQLVSTLIALIAIFATYNVFYLGKPNKELQVVMDQPISLVDVNPNAGQDIQVTYKGEPVNKVFLLQVRIENSGNQPISDTDYSRQLSFIFSPKYRLANVSAPSSSPDNIGMTVSKSSEQTAIVSKTLLNAGDSVSVQFVLIGDNENNLLDSFSVDGRIVGVKEIKKVSSDKKSIDWWIVALGAIGGAMIGFLQNVITDFFNARKKKALASKLIIPDNNKAKTG